MALRGKFEINGRAFSHLLSMVLVHFKLILEITHFVIKQDVLLFQIMDQYQEVVTTSSIDLLAVGKE